MTHIGGTQEIENNQCVFAIWFGLLGKEEG